MSEYTPLMQQFLELKKQHPDKILFFRLGDFYEMFFDDAKLSSRELEITLTSRDGGNGQRVDMCGVPHHSARTYILRLIEKGYKIAIAEQVEDPKQAKGLVKREVVKIITPGTITDPDFIKPEQNNFLVAISTRDERYGLAAIDALTGDFIVTELNSLTETLDEITRLGAKEIVIPDDLTLNAPKEILLTRHNKRFFRLDLAEEILLRHFKVKSLKGFGCDNLLLAKSAAGGLLNYLENAQKSDLNHVTGLRTYQLEKQMLIDSTARRNLEISARLQDGSKEGTLLSILDSTETAMGSRLLKRWLEQPLMDISEIEERQEAIEELTHDSLLRANLTDKLKDIYDLERLSGKLAYSSANARDLLALAQSLSVLPDIKNLLSGRKSLSLEIQPLPELVSLIRSAFVMDPPLTVTEGGIIRQGYNAEVDELRSMTHNVQQWLAQLEANERNKTGIKNLKIGFNRVFGYYIEITKSNLKSVPEEYIRKQTLVGSERFITPELKEQEEKILHAEEKLKAIEHSLFEEIRDKAKEEIEKIQTTAQSIAKLDVYLSLAKIALKNDYVRPKVDDGDTIYIEAGKHPVLDVTLGSSFIPNDTILDQTGQRLLLITGPNMAGKSTYMRQVALITIMAQIGSFVPAKKAQIGLVDRIFTRIGAADDLASGQSTFMVEMTEVANILHNATPKSLVLLDEVGRGTNTFDGISIAWAVVEYLHNHKRLGCKTLFATHYHELTQLEEQLAGVKNYSVKVDDDGNRVVFLHKIERGFSNRSYGIHVAKLAGIPESLNKRAREILATLEDNTSLKQLSFFSTEVAVAEEVEDYGILEEIEEIDINELTPLEALFQISNWQKRMRNGGENH